MDAATFLGLAAIVACTVALLAIFSGERVVTQQPVQRFGGFFVRAAPPSFPTGGAASVRSAFPTNF
ncbi:hypothetical protein GN316_06560 [Xylophilus sp. Kf1]|nr:hypothetical protein [Xylophilus sp. Kf1]